MQKNILKTILVSMFFIFMVSTAVESVVTVPDVWLWNSGVVYLKGDRVTWKDSLWEAKWWTKGDEPGTQGEWGVWKTLPLEVSLDITKAEWQARIDGNGFGVVDLIVSGTAYNADIVTVQTHGDGLISQHKVKVDAYGNFNEVVQIRFTHMPTDFPFTTSTTVRAKRAGVVVAKKLKSPTLIYPVGEPATARLMIDLVSSEGHWGAISDIYIDGIMYKLPSNVVLPVGVHELEVPVKWWVEWSWSDLPTFMPGNAPNPRTIDLTRDTLIGIVVGR
jgi:hypothetical protein